MIKFRLKKMWWLKRRNKKIFGLKSMNLNRKIMRKPNLSLSKPKTIVLIKTTQLRTLKRNSKPFNVRWRSSQNHFKLRLMKLCRRISSCKIRLMHYPQNWKKKGQRIKAYLKKWKFSRRLWTNKTFLSKILKRNLKTSSK